MDTTTATTTASATPAARPGIRRRASLLAAGTVAAALLTGAGFPALAEASPAATHSVSTAASAAAARPVTNQARPANGAVLTRRGSGSGSFAVDNTGSSGDAVVTLSEGSRAVLVLYVRAGQKASTSKVPDGTFDVFGQRGESWNTTTGHFDRPSSTGRFDRKASFTSSRTARGTRYTKVTLTLHEVPRGNTTLLPVPVDSVPS